MPSSICPIRSHFQPRKPVHDFHRLHTDSYHAQEQVKDVAGLALFCGPVVGVVGDAAGLVRFDLVALHDPFHGGSAVHYIVAGFLRDMRDRYPRVILDGRLVLLVREAHLLHAELALFRAADNHVWVRGLRLIIQMQFRQRAPRLAERPEVRRLLHQRQARQHLLQVRRERPAVVRRMQQAIDIIENVFLADLRPVACPAAFQNEIRYAVLAGVLAFFAVKKRRLVDGFLFVIVQREALACLQSMQVW